MKFNKLSILGLLAMTAAFAAAQDAPPADAPAEPEEKEAPVLLNLFTAGLQGWELSGNPHRHRQYASPARGLAVQDLVLYRVKDPANAWSKLVYRGTPVEDQFLEGRSIVLAGRGSIQVRTSRARFYDPTPTVLHKSEDSDSTIHASYKPCPEGILSLGYRWNSRELNDEAPADPRNLRSKYRAATLSRAVLGGNATVTLGDDRRYDKRNVLPNTVTRRTEFTYGRDFGDSLNLEGQYRHTRIDQEGQARGEIKTYGFNGALDLGPNTSVFFEGRRDDIDLKQIDNAWVRQRFQAGGRIVHHLGGSTVQIGYRHTESERFRKDQSFVDVPKNDLLDGRLTGTLGGIRYAVKGMWEHVSKPAVMQAADTRALFWDDRTKIQVNLTKPGEKLSLYANYTYQFDQNTPRDCEITSHHITGGGNLMLSDKTSAYFEVARDIYQSQGVVDVGGYDLDDFFPSVTSFAFGFDHVLSPKASLSASLSRFVNSNRNPLGLQDAQVDGTELTLTYRRTLGLNNSFEVFFAPWQYKDKVLSAASYRSTAFGLHYNMKF